MLVRMLILILFCFFVVYLPNKFFKLDYFKLREINITNDSKILHTELTNLIKNLYNKNTFDVDYKKLKNFLKEDIRIDDIKIENTGLGKIKIDVIEKNFLYYAVVKKNIYLVDQEGQLFGYMNEKKKQSVPLIISNTTEEIKEMVEILKNIKKRIIYEYVSQIYKLSENDYRIVLLDGVEIKTNPEVEFNKYEILEILYSEVKRKHSIEYIDLRFDDYIIKYKEDLDEKQ